MVVIAGCIVRKGNKILMVKEAKKKCYGQWNYPAGHMEEGEKITDAAIRETFEETGCKVKLTGVLPICSFDKPEGTRILVKFTADVIEENMTFDTNEILDVQWIDMETIKHMSREELRSYDINIAHLKDLEENKIFPLEVFDDTEYLGK